VHDPDADAAGGPDDGVAAATAGERALLDPAVRGSGAEALLHPDFVEFGSSGRRWDRSAILEAMAGDLSLAGEQVVTTDWSAEHLGPGVVHLTYRSVVGGRAARRSSVWRRTAQGWQLWFHQGTPVPDEVSSTAATAPAGE
jgi:hypothetical protein